MSIVIGVPCAELRFHSEGAPAPKVERLFTPLVIELKYNHVAVPQVAVEVLRTLTFASRIKKAMVGIALSLTPAFRAFFMPERTA